MRCILKKFKITIVVVCAMFMCFYSFAAVVSDNDGAIFITKVEFDALKATFQGQIDTYNNSIDSKIDSAIASYLSGFSSSTEESIGLFYSDMGKVKLMGYTYPDEWWEPAINLSQMSTFRGQFSNTNLATQTNYKYCKIVYNGRAQASKVAANLVDAGNEKATLPTTVVWTGRASNYFDSIKMSKIQAYSGASPVNASQTQKGFMVSPEGVATGLYYATHIIPGYYLSVSNLQTVWPQVWTWGTTLVNNSQDNVSSTWSGTIDVAKYSEDVITDQHIAHWDNYNLYVHDTDWMHTLTRLPAGAKRKGTATTITEDTLLGLSALSGSWYVMEHAIPPNNSSRKFYGGGLNGITYSGNGVPSTDQPVRVGLLASSYESKKILQTSTDFASKVGDKSYSTTAPSLLDGFIVGAANDKDTVKWAPVFINRVSTDGTTPTNDFELDVSFCIGGFDDGFNLKTGGSYIRKEGSAGTETFYTTTDGKLSITLKMPKDGIIYVKWRPTLTNTTGTTAFAKSWSADLDLTQCSNYTRKKEAT